MTTKALESNFGLKEGPDLHTWQFAHRLNHDELRPSRGIKRAPPPDGLRGFRQKKVRLVYDLPSSLISRLRNDGLMGSARKLDEKLRLLAERSTGAAA